MLCVLSLLLTTGVVMAKYIKSLEGNPITITINGRTYVTRQVTKNDTNAYTLSEDGSVLTVEKFFFIPSGPNSEKGTWYITTGIGGTGFSQNASIKTVVLPDSVTVINDKAFASCQNLESINLEHVKTIGNEAFSGCPSLKEASLGQAIASLGTGAFLGCTSLESVTIPGTLSTVPAQAFSGCTGLKSVVLEEGVSAIGSSAFYGCNLQALTLPGSFQTKLPSSAFGSADTVVLSEQAGLTALDNLEANGQTVMAYQVPEGHPTLSSGSDGLLYSKDGGTLLRYPSGRTETLFDATGITVGENAFRYNTFLKVILTSQTQNAPFGTKSAVLVDNRLGASVSYDSWNQQYGDMVRVDSAYAHKTISATNTKGEVTVLTIDASKRNFWIPSSFYGDDRFVTLEVPRYAYALLDNNKTLHLYADMSVLPTKGGPLPAVGEVEDTSGATVSEIFNFPSNAFQTYAGPTNISFKENSTAQTAIAVVVETEMAPQAVEGWFYNYKSCLSFDLTKLDTSRVKSMRTMFFGCNAVTSLDLGGFNTDLVTDMTNMFNGCKALKTLTFGEGFTTGKVTMMPNMFYNCSALTSLDLEAFNTEKVTDMSSMFYGCTVLKTLTFGEGFATGQVTNMREMFYNCSALTSLDLGAFNTEKVADMGGMFNGCKALETLTFGEGFKTSGCYYMGNMFNGCKALLSLDLTGFSTERVTQMQYMFQNCALLKELNLEHFITENVTIMNGMFSGCKALTSLDLRSFSPKVVTSFAEMFKGCSSLTEILLDPQKFAAPEATNMANMFDGCSLLATLDLSGLTAGKVQNFSYMFRNCSSLTRLDLAKLQTPLATSMQSMFAGCSSLTAILLGEGFKTAAVTTMHSMFSGCSSLPSVDLSGFDTSSLESMGSMFASCASMEVIDLSSFGADTVKLKNLHLTFMGCNKLKTVYVSERFAFLPSGEYQGTFNGATLIVGGNGTVFRDGYTNASSYGKIDGGSSDPGYFTLKGDYKLQSAEKPNIIASRTENGDGTATVTLNKATEYVLLQNLMAGTQLTLSVTDSQFTVPADFAGPEDTVTVAEILRKSYATLDSATNALTIHNPFAVLSADGLTLTLLDGSTVAVSGVYALPNGTTLSKAKSWNSLPKSSITYVTVADPFAPKNTTSYFQGFSACTGMDLALLDTSEVTLMEYMFSGCYLLESLDISHFDTRKVTSMRDMFSSCRTLTQLDLSHFDTPALTDMFAMFSGCSSLQNINFGSTFNTAEVYRMVGVFSYCTSLEVLDISVFDTANVVHMGSMFNACSALKTILVSEKFSTVTVGSSNPTSYTLVFEGCTSLEGGAGSTLSSVKAVDSANYVTATYARIDGGEAAPGYLTLKTAD